MESPRRVVVVEDDEDVRTLIRTMLEGGAAGCVVVGETGSAEDAVDLVAAHTPDFVILDNELAGAMKGLEVAPLLKAIAPRARIVLYSGVTSGLPSVLEGVDAVVSKAAPLSDLVDAVTGCSRCDRG